MKHNENSFVGNGGLKLFCQSWQPDTPPKATMAIVHGFGEHSSRYMNMVNYFVPRGYALYSFDLRGHGRSPGQRGHVMDWAEFRQDVDAFLRTVTRTSPQLPTFLFGHSLGGLIVLDYVLHEPVVLRGVIASAPALGVVRVSPILVTISRIMSRLYPAFSVSTRLDASLISRDSEVVSAYTSDPMVHDKGTARLGTEMTRTQSWVQAHANDLHLPLLFYQASHDGLTAPADGKRFFMNVPEGDKQYIAYEASFHEVHNDLEQSKLFADISRWLELHL